MSTYAKYPAVSSGGGGGGLIVSINADSTPDQLLTVGTSGLDFAIADDGSGGHAFNLPDASASARGALTSANFTTFNNKQPAGNYITALTGDVAASGPGSVAATLATVNSNVGSFGSATQVGSFTVNGKGLVTAASSVSIQLAESQVTNLVSDLAGKQATGNYITALTGDGTAAGPGSAALTLATVNAGVGSFGTATAVPAITVNAKGLVTAAASTNIQIAESQVTNLVSDLAGKQATGNYVTSLTGEATGSGPGATAVTLTNSAVIGKVLTGYTSGAGTVASTDTILQAIQKLNGNQAAASTTRVARYSMTAATATPTFPSSTLTRMDFDQQDISRNLSATTGASWSITVPQTGTYRMSVTLILVSDSNGLATSLAVYPYVNGAQQNSPLAMNFSQALAIFPFTCSGTDIISLTAADTLHFRVLGNQGGTSSFNTGAGNNFVSLEFIG